VEYLLCIFFEIFFSSVVAVLLKGDNFEGSTEQSTGKFVLQYITSVGMRDDEMR